MAEKKNAVKKIFKKGCSFMSLQETKLKDFSSRMPRWLWGNERVNFVAVAAVGNAGGLLSCWKEEFFTMETKQILQRFILMVGEIREFNFRCGIMNIYAPNDDTERETFWTELHLAMADKNVPWILMGDFNVVKTQKEKLGLTIHQSAVDVFADFISSARFIDLPLHGGKFTWCSNREVAMFCRLDRFLISPEVLNRFPDLVQDVSARSLSDHNSIFLEIERKN